jgi:hypothetical protein
MIGASWRQMIWEIPEIVGMPSPSLVTWSMAR